MPLGHRDPCGALFRQIGAFLLAALLVTGCGGGSASSPDGRLSGSVRIDGSSTVFPLTEAVAEEFMRAHPGVRVTVSESGTGGGFAKFLRGETDINDASRPITVAERETAAANDIPFIELPVGYDGIAVVAHPEVNWVDCLTVDELRRIWQPNRGITHNRVILYGRPWAAANAWRMCRRAEKYAGRP